MSWTLLSHTGVAFADGNAGHAFTRPGGAPSSGDLEVLCVNSDTTVSTPTGFSVATSAVANQGSYLFYRICNGSEGTTITVTTSGNFNTTLSYSQWTGASAFDTATNATASGSGESTPAVSSGTLAASSSLLIAFAALHNYSATPTSPVWSSGYTALDAANTGSSNSGTAQFTAYRTNAGTTAESPSVAWTQPANDRYILMAAFTPTGAASYSRSIAETITFSDTVTRSVALVRSVADSVTFSVDLAHTLTAAAEAPPAEAAPVQAGSWWQLVDIIREESAEAAFQRSRRPVACPNDGEPLSTGPRGELFCAFDGWRPGA